MSDTAFAQAVEADKPQPPPSKCTIAQLLRNGALEQTDLALLAQLWDGGDGWTLPRLTTALNKACNSDIGAGTVGRHLRGRCKCGPA